MITNPRLKPNGNAGKQLLKSHQTRFIALSDFYAYIYLCSTYCVAASSICSKICPRACVTGVKRLLTNCFSRKFGCDCLMLKHHPITGKPSAKRFTLKTLALVKYIWWNHSGINKAHWFFSVRLLYQTHVALLRCNGLVIWCPNLMLPHCPFMAIPMSVKTT